MNIEIEKDRLTGEEKSQLDVFGLLKVTQERFKELSGLNYSQQGEAIKTGVREKQNMRYHRAQGNVICYDERDGSIVVMNKQEVIL